jgi:ABC-type multidrug transport system fused ATPase/permease subunit
VFELLEEKPEVEDRPDAVELTEVRGHVLVDNVSFRYPTGEMVLKHVTVEVQPGEVVVLLADPAILILDEATSMVDTEAEQMIQRALENLMRGRTTFAIAHRLSTVRTANKIVVIDSGEIVEQADHETLMQAGGLYAEMYSRQLQLGGDWLGEG